MKPFTTHQEQIEILKNRGLIISDEPSACKILDAENYYNLINGYKNSFITTDTNGLEKFLPGTTFEEIHQLFLFDRALRTLLLPYFLKFETTIKSRLSYRFSQAYQKEKSYLDMKNYSKNTLHTKSILILIPTLYKVIGNEMEKSNSISHYLTQYGHVPLWVLVNFLTFGNIHHIYRCLQPNVKTSIGKDFGNSYKADYQVEHAQFSSELMEATLKTLNYFRNVCAHEERLFSFKLHKPSKSSALAKLINIPASKLNKGNVFTAVAFLKLVTPKELYEEMISNLSALFFEYSIHFTLVTFKKLMFQMGFEADWHDLLTSKIETFEIIKTKV